MAIALGGTALLASGLAGAFDADQDGISDESDAFPCKAGASAVFFAPAQGQHGMLLIEDQWPDKGDLDFNDAVIAYNYIFETNAQGQVLSVRATYNLLAVGGIFDNGLGLHLPVPTQSVASVRQTLGSGASVVVNPESSDPELTLRLLPNMRALHDNAAGTINSDPALPAHTGLPLEVQITFTQPVTLSPGQAPFDVFIFRSAQVGHEIHAPGFAGTAAMDSSLFGSADDGSQGSRHFIDTDGLPFVLNVPDLRPWPREGVSIEHLYPNIIQFAASGGTQAQDFYSTGVDLDYAYGWVRSPDESSPVAGAWNCPVVPGFVGPSTIPADTSCINAWGLSVEFGTSRDTYGYGSTMVGSDILITGYTKASLSGSNAGLQDIFVGRYQRDNAIGATARLVWMRQFGGAGSETGRAIAADPSGNLYVVGETRSALQGQTPLGGSDAFLMRLGSDGSPQWTRLLGAAGADFATSVAVNSTGIYVAGGSTSNLPGSGYTGPGPSSFLARYNTDGSLAWIRQYRTDEGDRNNYNFTTAIGLDSAGNIYEAGTEHRYSQHPSAAANQFLAKHDPSGNLLWVRHIGDYGYMLGSSDYRQASAFGLSVSPANEVFVVGNWESGSQVSSWNGWTRAAGDRSADMTLVKFSNNGEQQWAQSLGSSDQKADYALSVTSDSAGNVYPVGYTAGALPGQSAGGNFDYFAARFASNGSRTWLVQHNTANDDGAFGAHLDSAANALYVVGNTGEISGNPISFSNLYYGFISRHNLGTGQRDNFNLTANVNPLQVSCKAILDSGLSTGNGTYSIDTDGSGPNGAYDVYCDMTGDSGKVGLTLRPGNDAINNYGSITAGCPAGLSAYQVRSLGHANVLKSYLINRMTSGAWYWANLFSGPYTACPTISAQPGYATSSNTWVSANFAASALSPMNMAQNCNLSGYDPIPLRGGSGFANRGGSVGVLYLSSETTLHGTVICSTNDVP